MPVESLHETHCGHGVSYDDPCQECEAIWIEDTVVWLRRSANKAGFRLVPINRDTLPLTFGSVEAKGAYEIARALDLIGRDGVDDHDLAKVIIDSESEIRALLRWFESFYPLWRKRTDLTPEEPT